MVVPLHERLLLHDALLPPLLPTHVHEYGPEPLTEVAEPLEHRLLVGALVLLPPFAEPHEPYTAVTQLPVPLPDQLPWLQT